ncbi:MAG: hypothetical protein DRQ40_04670 [Gammaproteobacteria bacterium]|nr:MAG: hypothetical protein DRQ40_04670 [Gammaproteobacteria bacterium]
MFTQRIDIDRPDVIKNESKKSLSFKEVKDSLVKFLMQAEIPFQGAERLPVSIDLVYRELGQKAELSLEHHVSYKATVRLQGVKVNRRPIYVIAVPFELEELTHSERNKILALQSTFNVIVFDERDWTKLGLDISEKNWLSPMTRKVLKSWARILFTKITNLAGPAAVESDFTLNDLFSNIDKNAQSKLKKVSDRRIHDLKTRLLRKELELDGYNSLSKPQENLLESLVTLDQSSILWVEEVINSIVAKALLPVNTRKREFKDIFRQNNGKFSLRSPEKFGQIVYDYISTNRKTLSVEILGPGILTIQDKRTFQKITLVLVPTTTKKLPATAIKGIKKKAGQGLGFVLELKFVANSCKIEKLNVYAVCLTNKSHGALNRLNIQSSLKDGIYLWSDVV